MKSLWIILATSIFASLLSVPMLRADDDGRQFPKNATFTTLITTPRSIEGLTGDHAGNLYVGGSGAAPCPIWKINLQNPSLTVIGNIPVALAATCAFSGIALDALDLLGGPSASRLRRCANTASCGWLFLDTSKNQRRRWCAMETCGTADKMQRYRQG